MKRISMTHTVTSIAATLAFAAAAQTIEIDFIPALGTGGNAEGRVVWADLNAGNAGQYAVIAMLDASWGDQYVKPTYANYLSAVDASGAFTINITTEPPGDYAIGDVLFYLVRRSDFAGINGSIVKKGYMAGKHLAMLAVKRPEMVPEPVPSVSPGFVPAGTSITLSCAAGDTIRYTTDGSAPGISSPVYTSAFTVPATGALIIHAMAVRAGGATSQPASFTYLPRNTLDTPLFGLNTSLILGSENPGDALSEAAIRERLARVAPFTQWVRTFGTLDNGHEHINKIAKTELGLNTLIGVWVSTNASENVGQINGLRSILSQEGPAPDLIAVGNECSLLGVSHAVLADMLAAVRGVLDEFSLGSSVPVGSVDIGGAQWPRTVLRQLDFAGINVYCGTFDSTPQSQMATATAQFYTSEALRIGKKMALLTETGTPYSGGAYTPYGTGYTQTPSTSKAAAYLSAMLEWTHDADIPLFYFSAYDEAWKSRVSGGHPIEQYFGIFNAAGVVHPFYAPLLGLTPPPTPPPAPTELSASQGTHTGRVALSWTASTNATAYKVYRNTASNSTDAILIGSPTAAAYDDTTAVAGTTYYYWVQASNDAGDSAFSALAQGWAKALPTVIIVAFNGNGGTPANTNITQTVGSNYILPPVNPMRSGYTFDNWFTATAGGTQVTAATAVTLTNDHTLYARWTAEAAAGDYYVDASRPDDAGNGRSWATAKKTLQAAINLAAAGHKIIVADGVYAPITTDNKAITIQSVNGAAVTFIDGGETNRCATLGTGSGQTRTVLSGFTLTKGYAYDGGGVYGGTLNNCTLSGNTATHYGGGANDSILNNCLLSGNRAATGGGVAYGRLNNCVLTGNSASYYGGGTLGGTLNNCTLAGNSAPNGGGAYGGHSGEVCTLNNCIIWGNSPSNYLGSYVTIRYSCTTPKPSAGINNIDSDPLFVEGQDEGFLLDGPAIGDYRLQPGSPCINKGSNGYVVGKTDLDGNPRIQGGTVDMGAYEFPDTSVPPAYLSNPYDAETHPALNGATAYDGFMYDADNTVRGTITLNAKVDKKGVWTISAKAILQSTSISFSEKKTGPIESITLRKSGATLTVQVEGNRFYGTLSGVGGIFQVDGARNDKAERFTGLYNVALVDTAASRDGVALPMGYVSLSVGKAKAVKIAGRLADGTKVSGSAKLLEGLNTDNWYAIALYRPLYSKSGFISGLLWLDPSSRNVRVDTDNNWLVNWKKGSGVPNMLDVVGGYFGDGKGYNAHRVPSGLKFSAYLPDGLRPPMGAWLHYYPMDVNVEYSGSGNSLKLSLPKGSPSGATLSYTAKTGVFKGSFKLNYGPDAKGKHKAVSVPYTGVMVPQDNTLIGLGTGTVTINKAKHGIPVWMQ